ncbi:MAG: polyphenol oxidase family protein [Candidatus Saccharimonadales bacterium]
MVVEDQPACFGDRVIGFVSSIDEGQMSLGWDDPVEEVLANRSCFLGECGLTIDQATIVQVRYTPSSRYDVIKEVSAKDCGVGMRRADGPIAGCLIAGVPGVALFLPVADCIPAILYDPKNHVLALAHLGRHNSIANLTTKVVKHLQSSFKSNPADLLVWLGPSISPENYALERVDFAKNDENWKPYTQKVDNGFLVDLRGYAQNSFLKAGVKKSGIFHSGNNTATHPKYWSHYTEVTVRGRKPPPRFAALCALK